MIEMVFMAPLGLAQPAELLVVPNKCGGSRQESATRSPVREPNTLYDRLTALGSVLICRIGVFKPGYGSPNEDTT